MSVEAIDRKSGRVWRVRWRDEKGKARSRVLGKKRDAEAFDSELRRRKRLGELTTEDRGAVLLRDFAETWWQLYASKHLAARTRKSYAFTYDRHILPRLGDEPLRALGPQRLDAYQADLAAAGVGDPTIYRCMAILSGVLQRAVEWGYLQSNPARQVRKPTVKRKRSVRPVPLETIEAMVAAASPLDRVIIALLAYAGLRPGEALALRWSDVRPAALIIDAGKTGRTRIVPLAPQLRAVLDEQVIFDPDPDARVIAARWGDEQWKRWVKRRWRPLALRFGLDCPPYHLRHTFVSRLIADGQSVPEVAALAGHSATVALEVYAHLFDERAVA